MSYSSSDHLPGANDSLILLWTTTLPPAANSTAPLWNPAVRVLCGSVLCIICLVTSSGNFLVLYAVKVERRLHTVSNLLLVSLAVSDFLVGTLVMPMSAAYIIAGHWYAGLAVCQLWLAVDYIASTASILNMVALCLDRYWSVTQPLRYLRKRTKTRARFMIFSVWFLSALWLIPIVGWRHMASPEEQSWAPPDQCDTDYSRSIPLKIVTAIVNFFLPLLAMYVLYGRIFWTIRRRLKHSLDKQHKSPSSSLIICNSRSSGGKSSSYDSVPKAAIVHRSLTRSGRRPLLDHIREADDPEPPDRPGANSRDSNSSSGSNTVAAAHGAIFIRPNSAAADRDKMADAGLPEKRRRGLRRRFSRLTQVQKGRDDRGQSRLRREMKAARQLGVIMGVFTVCFMPYFIIFVVVSIRPQIVSQQQILTVTWIGYVNSTLNPFIYPLCNATFRNQFRKILRCEKNTHQGVTRNAIYLRNLRASPDHARSAV